MKNIWIHSLKYICLTCQPYQSLRELTLFLSLQFYRTVVSFWKKYRHITLNGNLTLDCKYSIEKGNNFKWNCFFQKEKNVVLNKTFHLQIPNLPIHFQDPNVQMQSIEQVKVFL